MKERESAAKRASFSGSLNIGMINIPVKAYPMNKDLTPKFKQICPECNSLIRHHKICERGHEIKAGVEILSGYPITKDKYITLSKAEINAAKPEGDGLIRLDRFCSIGEVDAHYIDRSYLLLPTQSNAAYALLKAAMEKAEKVAIGKVIISTKEHLVLVHAYGDGLVATTLHWYDEVLAPTAEELKRLPEPSEEELSLATDVINKLSGAFDLSLYSDSYTEKISEMIKAKESGIIINASEPKPEVSAGKSLMEQLRATMQELEA